MSKSEEVISINVLEFKHWLRNRRPIFSILIRIAIELGDYFPWFMLGFIVGYDTSLWPLCIIAFALKYAINELVIVLVQGDVIKYYNEIKKR